MTVRPIVPDVYQILMGFVDAFLIEGDGALTLIDTGIRSKGPAILDAVHALGK